MAQGRDSGGSRCMAVARKCLGALKKAPSNKTNPTWKIRDWGHGLLKLEHWISLARKTWLLGLPCDWVKQFRPTVTHFSQPLLNIPRTENGWSEKVMIADPNSGLNSLDSCSAFQLSYSLFYAFGDRAQGTLYNKYQRHFQPVQQVYNFASSLFFVDHYQVWSSGRDYYYYYLLL